MEDGSETGAVVGGESWEEFLVSLWSRPGVVGEGDGWCSGSELRRKMDQDDARFLEGFEGVSERGGGGLR